MGYYVQKSLSTAGVNATRMLYWIRKFVVDAAVAFPGRLTLLDSFLASGDWLSETGPGNGSYIVVESGYAHGGTKWQAIIGARNTSGTIGGIAGSVIGLVFGLAPDGGWVPSPGSQTFGAALFSGGLRVYLDTAANCDATNFHCAIVEKLVAGVATNVAFLLLGDNLKDGTWNGGAYVGAMYNFNTAYTKPCILLAGWPDWTNAGGRWGVDVGSNGTVPNASWTGWDAASLENTDVANWKGGKLLTDNGGEPAGFPILVHNKATNKVKGYLCEIFRTDDGIAEGTESSDHLRIVYNGLMFPFTP